MDLSAIRAGVVPDELPNPDIGPVSPARWLTAANRIMRLWDSKQGFKGKDLTNPRLLEQGFVISISL